MTKEVDVYWSFRSPYCYLAGPRLLQLQNEQEVVFRSRPVLPIALRIKDFFKQQSEYKRAYFFRDVARVAEYLDLPFVWPSPDPVTMDFATGEVPEEQSLIRRLTALGVAAERRGRGLPFAVALSSLIFGGTANWNDEPRLALVAEDVGLNLSDLERDISADPKSYSDTIEDNQRAHGLAGHWGVPLMVFRDEPFFGQDRIDLLAWRLAKAEQLADHDQ